ncbi:nucleotidyltransferase family protein [Candidatus Tokpelaia sp.]|uniref:nucleotidyltransferase family protein n=1 Tax=Candidatus Tokpelaia sp. TaxID=2233777 RepID=UPI00123AE933|nr:nucleotidyltransferase family protein [Candidatus Tokpelaia sp.]KAA6406097.1 nucleotidyltransferase family protein [Candidatus Tokpelaia sp.]
MAEQTSFDKNSAGPKTAMLLAAGLGTRLRPLTDNLPKPLVPVAGKTLLQRGLELLAAAGVAKTIINIHYKADILAAFVKKIAPHYAMELVLSDETDYLLDSAGGIIKALPLLGQEPFFVLNADTFWLEEPGSAPNLHRLAHAFNPVKQDMLLLTLPCGQAPGIAKADFLQNAAGNLSRAGKAPLSPQAVLYAGGLITRPAIFANAAANMPQSLNRYFDRAVAQKRLYGLKLQAEWHSVGSMAELYQTEAALQKCD